MFEQVDIPVDLGVVVAVARDISLRQLAETAPAPPAQMTDGAVHQVTQWRMNPRLVLVIQPNENGAKLISMCAR